MNKTNTQELALTRCELLLGVCWAVVGLVVANLSLHLFCASRIVRIQVSIFLTTNTTTMKTRTLFMALSVALLHSCMTPQHYYQVYDVEADGLQSDKQAVIFSNDDCDIAYDLWGEAGNSGFFFRNNTDEDIYIDLTRSFFIRNGIAYDYFADAEYTQSIASTTSSAAALSTSFTQLWYELPMWTPTVVTRGAQVTANGSVGTTSSITTRESRYICVPAKSAKFIAGFNISDYVYIDCGNSKLNRPKRESEHITYTKEESPLVFRNRICYYVGNSEVAATIDNSFWISGFTNFSGKEFFITRSEEECDNTSILSNVKVHKYRSANKFYNRYQFTEPKTSPFYY